MVPRRRRFERLLNVFGFAISIVVGLACGYAFTAVDALEDRLSLRSYAAKQAAKRM